MHLSTQGAGTEAVSVKSGRGRDYGSSKQAGVEGQEHGGSTEKAREARVSQSALTVYATGPSRGAALGKVVLLA